jgi:hypothetical protein
MSALNGHGSSIRNSATHIVGHRPSPRFGHRNVDRIVHRAHLVFVGGDHYRVVDGSRFSFPHGTADGIGNRLRAGFPHGTHDGVVDRLGLGFPNRTHHRVVNLACSRFPHRSIHRVIHLPHMSFADVIHGGNFSLLVNRLKLVSVHREGLRFVNNSLPSRHNRITSITGDATSVAPSHCGTRTGSGHRTGRGIHRSAAAGLTTSNNSTVAATTAAVACRTAIGGAGRFRRYDSQ